MIFDTDILSMLGKIGKADLLRRLFPETNLAITFEVYNKLLMRLSEKPPTFENLIHSLFSKISVGYNILHHPAQINASFSEHFLKNR